MIVGRAFRPGRDLSVPLSVLDAPRGIHVAVVVEGACMAPLIPDGALAIVDRGAPALLGLPFAFSHPCPRPGGPFLMLKRCTGRTADGRYVDFASDDGSARGSVIDDHVHGPVVALEVGGVWARPVAALPVRS